jgi:hypothetical protein
MTPRSVGWNYSAMPMLKNHKHEKFAQAIAEGKSDISAYHFAGFKLQPGDINRGNAHNLRNRPEVTARVAELADLKQAEFVRATAAADIRAIEESGIDKKSLLRDAEEIKRRCMQARPILDRQGNPVMVATEHGEIHAGYTFDATGALGAVNTQAKLIGAIVNRTTIEPGISSLPPERHAADEIAAHVLGKTIEREKTERLDLTADDNGAHTRPSTATLQ